MDALVHEGVPNPMRNEAMAPGGIFKAGPK